MFVFRVLSYRSCCVYNVYLVDTLGCLFGLFCSAKVWRFSIVLRILRVFSGCNFIFQVEVVDSCR